MGIHISIVTLDHKGHPEWDCGRQGDDREWPNITARLPVEVKEVGVYPDFDQYIRPREFEKWEKVPKGLCAPERWSQMVRILKSEPEYWLYYGF